MAIGPPRRPIPRAYSKRLFGAAAQGNEGSDAERVIPRGTDRVIVSEAVSCPLHSRRQGRRRWHPIHASRRTSTSSGTVAGPTPARRPSTIDAQRSW